MKQNVLSTCGEFCDVKVREGLGEAISCFKYLPSLDDCTRTEQHRIEQKTVTKRLAFIVKMFEISEAEHMIWNSNSVSLNL